MPATSATSSKGIFSFFVADTNSTNETNKVLISPSFLDVSSAANPFSKNMSSLKIQPK
jgi:hypothetical protein